MNKGRIEALTDGIVAIAATIMVLELAVPDKPTAAALAKQWPTFLAYIISFFQIYLAWRSHHNAFHKAEKVNSTVFVLNGIWIFFITLVPFVTGYVGQYPNERFPELLYIGTITLWSLAFQFLDAAITRCNSGTQKDVVRTWKLRITLFGGYALAAITIWLKPIISIIIIGCITLLWGVIMLLPEKSKAQEKTAE